MLAPAKPQTSNGPEADSIPTYYDLPALKPSSYGWTVGLYIYLGGLGAGVQILVTLLDWLGLAPGSGVITFGRGVAFFAAVAGGLLLISKLKVPKRFYNMLRIFRRTSPMSFGTYVLMSFGLFSLLAFGANLLGWQRIALACGTLAAIIAFPMTTYTACLLGTTSTPAWAAAPRILAAEFSSGALASGAAALFVISFFMAGAGPLARAFAIIALLALCVQTTAAFCWHLAIQKRGISLSANWGTMVQLVLVIAGGAIPALLFAGGLIAQASGALLLGAALALLAGPAIRIFTLYSGNKSAERPLDYFRWTGSRPARAEAAGD